MLDLLACAWGLTVSGSSGLCEVVNFLQRLASDYFVPPGEPNNSAMRRVRWKDTCVAYPPKAELDEIFLWIENNAEGDARGSR